MSTRFSCRVASTDPSAPLGLELWLDDNQFFNTEHLTAEQEIHYDFEDDSGKHELRFIMKNKTDTATKIDAEGNILSDACVTITDVAFDGIELEHVFVENTEYSHDFNGTQQPITEPFYGTMGCNGVVTFEFTSPFYLWLLEHM